MSNSFALSIALLPLGAFRGSELLSVLVIRIVALRVSAVSVEATTIVFPQLKKAHNATDPKMTAFLFNILLTPFVSLRSYPRMSSTSVAPLSRD
jgi:hypothetical protein